MFVKKCFGNLVFLRGVVGASGMNVKKTKPIKITKEMKEWMNAPMGPYQKTNPKPVKLYTTKQMLAWNKRRPSKKSVEEPRYILSKMFGCIFCGYIKSTNRKLHAK